MLHHPDFPSLMVVAHPLVQDKLSRMRMKDCPTGQFRRLLREISLLMGYEVTRGLSLTDSPISTSVREMSAPVLDGALPAVVPILRAGMGMAEGLVELIPDCEIGHIGLYRDEETCRPVEYLVRLPEYKGNMFILTDPMLATGHSSLYAIQLLERHGIPADKIILMCLVASPEGVSVIQNFSPHIRIFTAALDECLNDKAYIVPGLGDAGDRLFGTG